MEFQSTDEATKREACERVKQIVKAIKAIKIKYYLNFSKISEKDQETYQKLQANLESISESHNLQNLKIALMAEIDAKYDRKDNDMGQKNEIDPEDNLKACYGAIDAQKEALSRGRIEQASRCQQKLKEYEQKLNPDEYQEVLNYKREKFAELMQTREQVDAKMEECNDFTKSCHETKEVLGERKKAMDILQGLLNKQQAPAPKLQEETLRI